MTPKNLDLVIYDTNGTEHVVTITRKEAVDIISNLAEHLK